MEIMIGSRHYQFLLGSDLARDGMYLEANETSGHERITVGEVFYCDADRRFSFTAFVDNLPLELVERLASEARRRLPSLTDD